MSPGDQGSRDGKSGGQGSLLRGPSPHVGCLSQACIFLSNMKTPSNNKPLVPQSTVNQGLECSSVGAGFDSSTAFFPMDP